MTKPSLFDGYPEGLKLYVPFGTPVRGAVDRCHDGDTVLCLIDPQYEGYVYRWIRARGINAPELDEPGGPEALAFAELLLPFGTHVAIYNSVKVPSSGVMDKSFERYVAQIMLPDGSDFSTRMVDAGHAVRLAKG